MVMNLRRKRMLLGNTLEEPRIIGTVVTPGTRGIQESAEVLTAGNVPVEEIRYDDVRSGVVNWRMRHNGRYYRMFAMKGDVLVADHGFVYVYPSMLLLSSDYDIISEKGDSQ